MAAKKVLVLGAGLVARPLIQYLLKKTRHLVVCADLDKGKAEAMIGGLPRGEARSLNVDDRGALEKLIKGCDLVVSLLPYTLHPAVAEVAIRYRKNMVTSSYVSDAMRALDGPAREAGVLILNEIGLDPGIDHMSAMRIIHGVRERGGKVTSFRSYCGGLPAPEANDNPMGYKFSWSPRGVLMAGRNAAKYLEAGNVIEIPGPELFKHHWYLNVPGTWPFEAYPNRNSLPYTDVYELNDAVTMFRGTLRYPGWCRFWYKMAQLGWLSDAPRTDLEGRTWSQIMRQLLPGQGSLQRNLCQRWDVPPDSDEIKRIHWLGLIGEERVPAGHGNLLDLLCSHLIKKLAFRPGERDMVVLYHEFEAEYSRKKERITSTLVEFGEPEGDSAMSRTVSLPAAIAAKHILAGTFKKLSGVHIPVLPEIFHPVLDELEKLKIRCVEVFQEI